jgi:endo-1,4-beta-xylanase
MQMHLTSGGISTSSLRSNMQRFANLGVGIYITEMDVRLPTPASSTDLNTTQPTIYRNVVNECLLQLACRAIQIWGFTDAHSWIPGFFTNPPQGAALIFDANYNAKPAYFAIQDRLAQGRGGSATSTPTRTPTASVATSTPTRTPTPVLGATATPTRTATPSPGSACAVTYAIVNQWNNTPTSGGFQVNLAIRNTGTTAIDGWTLAFSFPNGQTISGLWNAAFSQSGASVTITANQSWNSTIQPGATMNSVGFTGSWSGTNGRPTAFSVRGSPCTIA